MPLPLPEPLSRGPQNPIAPDSAKCNVWRQRFRLLNVQLLGRLAVCTLQPQRAQVLHTPPRVHIGDMYLAVRYKYC